MALEVPEMRSTSRFLLAAAFIAAILAVAPVSVWAQTEDTPPTIVTPPAGDPDAVAAVIPPIVWDLVEFPSAGPINEPGRYTVQFLQDGQISVRADCNWVAGLWTATDGALEITITRTTLVGCPPDSLEQPFVVELDNATAYTLDGFVLTITGPTGVMRFTPAGPPLA